MNIALVDTTQKRFYEFVPLALLRLSTAHKNAGDTVELVSAGKLPRRRPDKIYFSFIFLFNYQNDVKWVLTYSKKYPQAGIMVGGIGPTLMRDKYARHMPKKVEIFEGRDLALEKLRPDFEITKYDYSYGFTTRGCPNKCDWCIVPKFEGRQSVVPNWQIQINTEHPVFFAFDNNILACGSDHFESVLKYCSLSGVKIDFNQAMDAEIFHKNSKIQQVFLRYPHVWHIIRFAWDSDRVNDSVVCMMDFIHKHKIGANMKSLLMLYDAGDPPEVVYKRIKTVMAHPAGFAMKLMRFKDVDTGVLLRKWGGIGDLFADASAFAITGAITQKSKFWQYMLEGDLQLFIARATYIRQYIGKVKNKITENFIEFVESQTDVKNVKG